MRVCRSVRGRRELIPVFENLSENVVSVIGDGTLFDERLDEGTFGSNRLDELLQKLKDEDE